MYVLFGCLVVIVCGFPSNQVGLLFAPPPQAPPTDLPPHTHLLKRSN